MGHQTGALPERTKYKKGTWPERAKYEKGAWPERAKYNNGFAKITFFVVAWFPPPSPHACLGGPLAGPLGRWAPDLAAGPLAEPLGPSMGPWAPG